MSFPIAFLGYSILASCLSYLAIRISRTFNLAARLAGNNTKSLPVPASSTPSKPRIFNWPALPKLTVPFVNWTLKIPRKPHNPYHGVELLPTSVSHQQEQVNDGGQLVDVSDGIPFHHSSNVPTPLFGHFDVHGKEQELVTLEEDIAVSRSPPIQTPPLTATSTRFSMGSPPLLPMTTPPLAAYPADPFSPFSSSYSKEPEPSYPSPQAHLPSPLPLYPPPPMPQLPPVSVTTAPIVRPRPRPRTPSPINNPYFLSTSPVPLNNPFAHGYGYGHRRSKSLGGIVRRVGGESTARFVPGSFGLNSFGEVEMQDLGRTSPALLIDFGVSTPNPNADEAVTLVHPLAPPPTEHPLVVGPGVQYTYSGGSVAESDIGTQVQVDPFGDAVELRELREHGEEGQEEEDVFGFKFGSGEKGEGVEVVDGVREEELEEVQGEGEEESNVDRYEYDIESGVVDFNNVDSDFISRSHSSSSHAIHAIPDGNHNLSDYTAANDYPESRYGLERFGLGGFVNMDVLAGVDVGESVDLDDDVVKGKEVEAEAEAEKGGVVDNPFDDVYGVGSVDAGEGGWEGAVEEQEQEEQEEEGGVEVEAEVGSVEEVEPEVDLIHWGWGVDDPELMELPPLPSWSSILEASAASEGGGEEDPELLPLPDLAPLDSDMWMMPSPALKELQEEPLIQFGAEDLVVREEEEKEEEEEWEGEFGRRRVFEFELDMLMPTSTPTTTSAMKEGDEKEWALPASQMPTPPASPPPVFGGPPRVVREKSIGSGGGVVPMERTKSQLVSSLPQIGMQEEVVVVGRMQVVEGEGGDGEGKVKARPAWSVRAGEAPPIGFGLVKSLSQSADELVGGEVGKEVEPVLKVDGVWEGVDNKEQGQVEDVEEVPQSPLPGSFPDTAVPLDLPESNSEVDGNVVGLEADTFTSTSPIETTEPSTDAAPSTTTRRRTISSSLSSSASSASSAILATLALMRYNPNQPQFHGQDRRRGVVSPLDVALAMQMRPGLGVGADPAWMVRFLMAMFGWFAVVVSGGGEY